MTVKERLHHLIEELDESDLLVAERMLRDLIVPKEPIRAPQSDEERQARVAALFGSMPRLPSVENFLREKHEEAEREEDRLTQSTEGQAA